MGAPAKPIKLFRLNETIKRMIREEVENFRLHKLPGVVDYITTSGSNHFADVFLNGNYPKFQDAFATLTNWTTVSGSFTVTSGVATSGGTTDDIAVVTNSSYGDLTYICQINMPVISGTQEAEIVFRYTDANNYYAFVFANNTLILRKVSGGTASTLASVAVTFTTGTWYWLRVQAQGQRLTAWTSTTGNYGTWTNQIQATDSTFASGKIGIRDVSLSAEFKLPTVYTGVTPAIPVRPGVGTTISIGQEVWVERVNFNSGDLLLDMPRVI